MSIKLQKALLIDDDFITNYFNQAILKDSGIFEEIETAETAVEALDKIEYNEIRHSLQPEIIFLDINMPGLNGWDFINEYNVGRNSPNRKTVIVILTSSNNPEDKIKAVYAKGVYAYINKPLTKDKLQSIVRKYLF